MHKRYLPVEIAPDHYVRYVGVIAGTWLLVNDPDESAHRLLMQYGHARMFGV
jgi:hypothetical protein